MKNLLLCTVCAILAAAPATAQVSESTKDWPAWQKASVGVLGASSILVTIAAIGLSNADSDTNGGEGSESDSNGNDNKGQGYVEELKDELLVFVGEASRMLIDEHATDEEILSRLGTVYPVVTAYYSELIENHPEVVAAMNDSVEGTTTIDRLNKVMMVHLFSKGQGRQ